MNQSATLSDSLSSSDRLETFSLRDLWQSIWRHKGIIVSFVLLSTILAIAYVKLTPKIYLAQSVILIENNEKNAAIESVVTSIQMDLSLITSEMQVISSRMLMDSVLTKLDLYNNPHVLQRPPGVTKQIKSSIMSLISAESASEENALKSAETKVERDALISTALSNLELEQVEKSRTIVIGYKLHDKEVATAIANEIAYQYINRQLDARNDTIGRASNYLADQVSDLRKKVKEAEDAVVAYREKNNIVSSRGSDLIDQDISDLSAELADAKIVLGEAQVRYNDVKNSPSPESSPSILKFPLIQRLREREAEALRALADARSQYGVRHPTYQAAKAQAESARRELTYEVQRLTSSLRREYESARQNVGSLKAQLKRLTNEYNVSNSASVELQALQREAKSNSDLLESLTLRLKETDFQKDDRWQEANARILSEAPVPSKHVSPKSMLIVAAALIAGMGLGMAVAIIVDQLSSGIISGQQVQQITGAPNITLIPLATSKPKENIHILPDYPIFSKFSGYTESLRAVSTYLNVQAKKSPDIRVFNFTSATESEGKTTTVAGIGRQMALEGKRVLIIDCDIRHPSLTKIFTRTGKKGLTDCLSEGTPIEEHIHVEKETGLHVMPIGITEDPDIISRHIERWRDIMVKAHKEYDIILLDSPPIVYVADIRLIARESNNLLCVRWEKTSEPALEFTMNLINDLQCKLTGTVLTMVDIKKNATYNYSDSKYYSQAAKSYYQ